MLSRWPIRYKLLFGVATLFLVVVILSCSSLWGVYSYRQLVRSISRRSAELPQAAEVTRQVADLRYLWNQVHPATDFSLPPRVHVGMIRNQFGVACDRVALALGRYKTTIEQEGSSGTLIDQTTQERKAVEQMEKSLERIVALSNRQIWMQNDRAATQMNVEMEKLYEQANALPEYLQARMRDLRDEVRGQYRALIGLTWATSILSCLMLGLLALVFYRSVFHPLRTVIEGSRRVAAGDFHHRIHLDSHDEMAELARAMNAMTVRFQQIRDDLDRQVQQRTREVIRNEQLASVGFLAAGVAHEINNPLASIAWCAESLESRLFDLLHDPETSDDGETKVVRDYLRTIQNESFRCKGITEQLLDFSRMGHTRKEPTDLCELVLGVTEMVKHLGRYRDKHVHFDGHEPIQAAVNAQEIKQVVLNLITNALDSVDTEGHVRVHLDKQGEHVRLAVIDDGCGMTEEVMNHLFEPFFTRRRDGQGTGLGLSITYRIVADHGGHIDAHSDGPGQGARFTVLLPLDANERSHEIRYQAA